MREHAFTILDQERQQIKKRSEDISRELSWNLFHLYDATECPFEQFRAFIDLNHSNPAAMPRDCQNKFVNDIAAQFLKFMKAHSRAKPMYFPVWKTLVRCMRDQMLREWKAAGK